MNTYIDVHSHLHSSEYDTDRQEVLARMSEAGVSTIVVGTDKEESKKAVELATGESGVWASVGQHPVDNKEEIFDADFYHELSKNKKVVAVGECGLDYFRTPQNELTNERVRQTALFKQHMELAIESDLPLMVHCRPSGKTMDAHEELLEILDEKKIEVGDKLRGNIHFFTGNIPVAERYIALGFTLSFPGIITFTKEYDELIKHIPVTAILSETDSPYATPAPYRGKRNEPTYVIETIKRIADIRNENVETLVKQIEINTKRVFRI